VPEQRDKGPVIPLAAIEPTTLNIGEWYLGVSCLNCKKQIALEVDQTYRTRPSKISQLGDHTAISVTCPYCNAERQYEPGPWARFRHRVQHIDQQNEES
jgi:hypothetical protein